MVVLDPSACLPNSRAVVPFFEGDVVCYLETTFRKFTVARCYARTIKEESRWIVEERNADTHDAADLELVRAFRASPTGHISS